MEQKNKWTAAGLLVSFLCVTLLCGCAATGKNQPADVKITKISDLSGKKVTTAASSVVSQTVDELVGNIQHLYLEDLTSQLEAVQTGKADAAITDEPVARLAVAQHPDLMILDEKLADDSYGFAFRKGDPLAREVSRVILQFREDGTLDEMGKKWFGMDEAVKILPQLTYKSDFDGSAGVLRYTHNVITVPMSYLGSDGKASGHDVELAMRIAYELNMKLETTAVDNAALLMSLAAGKSDMVGGCLSITEERKKTVDFSESYYSGGMVAIIRKDAAVSEQTAGYTSIQQLGGQKVGVLTGSLYVPVLEEYVPGAIPVFFNNVADQVEALRTGKIEAVIYDEPTIMDILSTTDGIRLLPETLGSVEFAMIARLDNTELINQVNSTLDEMEANGQLDDLRKIWYGDDESAKVLPQIATSAADTELRVATSTISPPYSYVKDNKIVGYEVAFSIKLAERLGQNHKITDMDFAAIIPAVSSGKCDLGVGQIAVTEERGGSVLFSKSIDSSSIRMIAREEGAVPGTSIAAAPWYQSFAESFEKTFITEARYKLILQGLGTTILISLLSVLLGTILGFGICLLRRSRKSWLNIPAGLFIRLVQGVPIVVILMILFYLVFTDPNANPIMVAVIGFSLNFAAYSSEMMRTGIDTVDKGQLEAASALGFTKVQVFCKITLPQAARHVLPVFKGEFISMMKMTSVVGYIAIQDLTKMSDIIRSRTYEAFFPLISTAVIYFVISCLLTMLLTLIEVKLDPLRRRRVVKGVV